MPKKLNIVLAVLLLLLFTVNSVFAQNEVNIYFFWGKGCPHCSQEKPFLEQLQTKYPQVKIHDFEIWNNTDNRNLLIAAAAKLDTNVSGVPFTVIGEQYFTGWLNQETTGKAIEKAVQNAL